jgi:hypothetical protein
MAVGVLTTWEMKRDKLIQRALNLAGVLNAATSPKPEQIALGVDLLQMAQSEIQTDGIILRGIEQYSVALTSGTASYTQPSDTLSIEDGGIMRSSQGVDVPISILGSMRDYLSRSLKTITGQPVEYYPEEQTDGTWKIFFYPVPDGNWPTFIYPRGRRLKDVDSGLLSIDFPVKFTLPLTMRLASLFCHHYNRAEKAKDLLSEYMETLGRAMGDETNRGPLRLIAEPLIWSGR